PSPTAPRPTHTPDTALPRYTPLRAAPPPLRGRVRALPPRPSSALRRGARGPQGPPSRGCLGRPEPQVLRLRSLRRRPEPPGRDQGPARRLLSLGRAPAPRAPRVLGHPGRCRLSARLGAPLRPRVLRRSGLRLLVRPPAPHAPLRGRLRVQGLLVRHPHG